MHLAAWLYTHNEYTFSIKIKRGVLCAIVSTAMCFLSIWILWGACPQDNISLGAMAPVAPPPMCWVYVCMGMYACSVVGVGVCLCVCACLHGCACMHVLCMFVCACMYVCMGVCMHVCVHVCVHVYATYMHMWLCLHGCEFVCVCQLCLCVEHYYLQ